MPHKKSTILIPDDIFHRYNQRETAGFILLSQCEALRESDHFLYQKPSDLSTQRVLQAYRWKAMLIQTTLLSALNGICFELTSKARQTHSIQKYKITGPEHNWASTNKLILQNFVFLPQDNQPEWFESWTGAMIWESLRRHNMQHLFHDRRLTSAPSSPPELPNFDHDLTQFVFGMRQVVAGKRIQYLWPRDETDNRKFTAEAHGAEIRTALDVEYSTRIESSIALWESAIGGIRAQPQNLSWYQGLLANA